LQHAHEKGLVHQDLKPANLLLSHAQPVAARHPLAGKQQARASPEVTTTYVAPAALSKGIVKILDLGLARFLMDHVGDSQLTKEGLGVGTPDYMAPEHFRDSLHADARMDIYGLGCTLCQLISGTVPFPGSSFSEKAEAHAKKEPIPLEERCPEVPAGLALVVSKMMAKHPAERFQTAAEAAEALAPYLAGASHATPLLRQMRFDAGQLTMRVPKRRKRLRAWAGANVAAACAIGLPIVARPSIFPPSPSGLPGGARSQASAGTPASEPTKPKVVRIENGLTVAQDGTGQYTTISEALAKIDQPGMTIQVLADATYTESITIGDQSRFEGLILISTRQARIAVPSGAAHGVAVLNVPGVTVRGFRIHVESQTRFGIAVTGASPGALPKNLECVCLSNIGAAIHIEHATLPEQGQPIQVKGCKIRGINGITVITMNLQTRRPLPCRRIVLRDHELSELVNGIVLMGQVTDIHVSGNRIWGCARGCITLSDLLEDSSNVLVANNTLKVLRGVW